MVGKTNSIHFKLTIHLIGMYLYDYTYNPSYILYYCASDDDPILYYVPTCHMATSYNMYRVKILNNKYNI